MSTDDKQLFYRQLFVYRFGACKQPFLRDALKQFLSFRINIAKCIASWSVHIEIINWFSSSIHCTYEWIAHTPEEMFPIYVSLQLRIVFFSSHKFAAVTVWEVKLKPAGIKKTISNCLSTVNPIPGLLSNVRINGSSKNGECAFVKAKLPWADQMVAVVCPKRKISETEKDFWDQIRMEQHRMGSTCNKLYHKT